MSSCATCHYWGQFENSPERGKWQAHPPTVVTASDFPRTKWPITFSADWCGEW